MKRYKKHRLWTVGVVALALLSFLTGTSLACFQREAGSVRTAEDCCQGHCQHVMVGDTASQCCQSHQTKVAHALSVASPTKAASLVALPLFIALILPVVLQSPEKSPVHLTTRDRLPPSPPLYTFHCALLIWFFLSLSSFSQGTAVPALYCAPSKVRSPPIRPTGSGEVHLPAKGKRNE